MKLLALLFCAVFSLCAYGQSFPSKPLRIVVPFPAGGTTDIVARLVGQRMSESMGQPVLVENRAGAGGTIAAAEVARSTPDGYTLLIHNVTFPIASVAAALANRATYNVDSDFAGVSIAVYVPFVWTAHPSVPGNNLKELMTALQKDKTLRYSYGSTGPGSTMHILGEALSREAKVELTHVPFKGAAPMKQEIIVGRVNFGGDQLSSSLADIKAGKLKALATSASRRIPELPEVPTVRELGYPVLEADGWNGFFAPAKTPREVIDRLQKEVAAAVKNPDTSKRLRDMAAEPVGSPAADQEAVLKRQMDQFRPIIREIKID
ncbi:MAG TPA: tripartite tricarboxylate transporter substrate-binding protein, partial [Burkholderiales bacterium]|nr:tripartite tricarboxylate transporter substrate-binding protein [Burkholderiales bacterium]